MTAQGGAANRLNVSQRLRKARAWYDTAVAYIREQTGPRGVLVAPRLVFIHGIGGSRRPAAELQSWLSALAQGARAAGLARAAASLIDGSLTEVVFADYSSVFRKRDSQGSGDLAINDDEARLVIDLLSEVIAESRGTHGQAMDKTMARAMAQLQPTGTAQGTGDLVRLAVNAASTFLAAGPWKNGGQWVSGKLLVRDLAQVARYLTRGEPSDDGLTIDARIRRAVAEAFGQGPAVVVAHSLGTVVSFELLHERPAEIPLWVTLGSPLAMRSLVWPRIIPRPPATPMSVERWLNFWDRDDIITARPILEEDFASSAGGVKPQSARVDSDGIWVHTATKYLAHDRVARPVIEVIQSYGAATCRQRG